MTHRIFKHNGQVTDRVDTYGNRADLSPDEKAQAEVAAALGVDVGAVTVEHVEERPPVEVVIPPAVPAPPDPAVKAALDALAAPLVQAVESVLTARALPPMTTAEQASVRDGAVYLASRGQFGKAG